MTAPLLAASRPRRLSAAGNLLALLDRLERLAVGVSRTSERLASSRQDRRDEQDQQDQQEQRLQHDQHGQQEQRLQHDQHGQQKQQKKGASR